MRRSRRTRTIGASVDDFDRQAADFRDEGPEVQQAFIDGYQDGRNVE